MKRLLAYYVNWKGESWREKILGSDLYKCVISNRCISTYCTCEYILMLVHQVLIRNSAHAIIHPPFRHMEDTLNILSWLDIENRWKSELRLIFQRNIGAHWNCFLPCSRYYYYISADLFAFWIISAANQPPITDIISSILWFQLEN